MKVLLPGAFYSWKTISVDGAWEKTKIKDIKWQELTASDTIPWRET